MNALIESFKRLYHMGVMTDEMLSKFLKDKKITQDEYDYIVNK